MLLFSISKPVLFLFMLFICYGTTARNPVSSNLQDANALILTDGTLNTTTGFEGSLDLADWHVELDPLRGPVFMPAPPLADPYSALNMGLNGWVNAIAISGTDVYVGGNFTGVAPGVAAVPGLNYIAKWNGTAWSTLDMGLNSWVNAITVSGTDVYVGGKFTGVGSGGAAVTDLRYIAKWNGTAWSALGKGLDDVVHAIAISGTDVYVGGNFTADGSIGTATSLMKIAKWNGTTWFALDSGLNYAVYALAVSGTDVYVGGLFTDVGQDGTAVIGLNHIAKWNGTAWSALDRGLNNQVKALAVSGTDVYVGGWFIDVGLNGTTVSGINHVAKWNGTAWSALAIGLNSWVYALAVSGTDVYVGGIFGSAGTNSSFVSSLSYIAKWNGTAWSALDNGVNRWVNALAVSGTDVYLGGEFTNVGLFAAATVTGINRIAKYPLSVVLPVELLGFKGKYNEGGNLLTWQTAIEVNNKGFEIERKQGDAWQNIGFVAAKSKANDYTFKDEKPLDINYYRLKMVDNDGTFTYSKVISVSMNKAFLKELNIYPNPTKASIVVEYPLSIKAEISVLNALGQLQKQITAENNLTIINLQDLPAGMYFVRLNTEGGYLMKKFVKE